jgi:hypothetical protein
MNKHKTGPKLGTGGKRNKWKNTKQAQSSLLPDGGRGSVLEAQRRYARGSDRDEHAKISSVQAVVDTGPIDTTLTP